MSKTLTVLFAIACLGTGVGCAAEDEGELETVEYIDYGGTCHLEWLGFQRDLTVHTEYECQQAARDLGWEHCQEVNAGAPGEDRIEIHVEYFSPPFYYDEYEETYHC